MTKVNCLILAVITMSVIAASCNNPKQEVMKEITEVKAMDPANLDTTICPTEDFYQYATGGWQKNNPLPDDESIFGSFNLLAKETNLKVNDMIKYMGEKNPEKNSIEWKISTFYNLGMDTVKIEKDGINPIKDYLKEIDKIENNTDVIKQIAKFHKMGISSGFSVYGSADRENSDMQIAYLHQGGIGLPNRDYYTSDDARSIEIRENYLLYLKDMFVLLGEDEENAQEIADEIMKFETKLARNSMTMLELRDIHNTTNRMNLAELTELSPATDLKTYFQTIGLPAVGIINVGQTEFFEGLSKIFEKTEINTWKNYFTWNLINSAAPYLSSDFDNRRFEFYGTFLSGTQTQQERWRRVVNQTNSSLGEAVGQIFVKEYFPPEAKERMIELVDNLKFAFEQRIKKLEWMTENTKENAIEKLYAMNVKIGYPDEWRDYNYLNIMEDSYYANVVRANEFNFDYMIGKIGKPVNKEEWLMNPQTVNAYYMATMNEICFPAGILQPPFFFMHGDDAVNYGAIGMVIGHEITHGFDNRGKNFDKDGNLTNWWTDEDQEKFDKEAQILIDRYNQIVVLDDLFADGELTLGENIADYGGLKMAYDALMIALEDNHPGLIDSFTPEQRFFLAYANVWAQNIRDEEIMKRTKEGVHSLGRWRVNGQMPGLEEFHKAFDAKPGDPMYLPAEKRTNIW
jgi:putative endopeptidase